jgi:hypothetical protein
MNDRSSYSITLQTCVFVWGSNRKLLRWLIADYFIVCHQNRLSNENVFLYILLKFPFKTNAESVCKKEIHVLMLVLEKTDVSVGISSCTKEITREKFLKNMLIARSSIEIKMIDKCVNTEIFSMFEISKGEIEEFSQIFFLPHTLIKFK